MDIFNLHILKSYNALILWQLKSNTMFGQLVLVFPATFPLLTIINGA